MGLVYQNPEKKIPNVLAIVFVFIFLAVSVRSESSIYDHLRRQGLPIGIFPKGITDFSIDIETGRFWVNLTRPCNAQFENQFRFDFNISGLLSYGQIGNLSGVEQQELFLWFPVKGIRVDVPSSGLIYFDVGVVDKQFSLSLFESPRDCTAIEPEAPPSSGPSHLSAPSLSSVDEEDDGDEKQPKNIEYVIDSRDLLRAAS